MHRRMNTFLVYSFQYQRLASFIVTFKSWSARVGLIYFTEVIVRFVQDTLDSECMLSEYGGMYVLCKTLLIVNVCYQNMAVTVRIQAVI